VRTGNGHYSWDRGHLAQIQIFITLLEYDDETKPVEEKSGGVVYIPSHLTKLLFN
jgi:spore germination protein YaaH